MVGDSKGYSVVKSFFKTLVVIVHVHIFAGIEILNPYGSAAIRTGRGKVGPTDSSRETKETLLHFKGRYPEFGAQVYSRLVLEAPINPAGSIYDPGGQTLLQIEMFSNGFQMRHLAAEAPGITISGKNQGRIETEDSFVGWTSLEIL